MKNSAYMWDMFYTELADIVGYDHVLTDEADKLAYSSDVFWIPNLWIDRKRNPLKPDYIVQPDSVDEIRRVLALADKVAEATGVPDTEAGLPPELLDA